MQTTAYKHITVDDKGVARIDGTRMKVLHIAEELLARNSTPQQMQEAWPHLSLSQIHSALAYYYDHQAELDEQIKQELAEYDQALAANQNSPLRQKLRQLGRLP
ncbi:MAG TPA: DUF433 domain-containing protein [Tepidisphaeraceae bacterium]|jgi:uncharacterized protein (DUF433 family)